MQSNIRYAKIHANFPNKYSAPFMLRPEEYLIAEWMKYKNKLWFTYEWNIIRNPSKTRLNIRTASTVKLPIEKLTWKEKHVEIHLGKTYKI